MYPHPIKFRVYKSNKELVFETVPKVYDYMYGVVAYALQNAFRAIDGFTIERVEIHHAHNLVSKLKN